MCASPAVASYRFRTLETARANARRSYYKHHVKMIEKRKRRWAKERSKKLIALSPDAVFGMINSAVSRALPRFVRDDVLAAMCLAVLEGQLFVENIAKEANSYALTIGNSTPSRPSRLIRRWPDATG